MFQFQSLPGYKAQNKADSYIAPIQAQFSSELFRNTDPANISGIVRRLYFSIRNAYDGIKELSSPAEKAKLAAFCYSAYKVILQSEIVPITTDVFEGVQKTKLADIPNSFGGQKFDKAVAAQDTYFDAVSRAMVGSRMLLSAEGQQEYLQARQEIETDGATSKTRYFSFSTVAAANAFANEVLDKRTPGAKFTYTIEDAEKVYNLRKGCFVVAFSGEADSTKKGELPANAFFTPITAEMKKPAINFNWGNGINVTPFSSIASTISIGQGISSSLESRLGFKEVSGMEDKNERENFADLAQKAFSSRFLAYQYKNPDANAAQFRKDVLIPALRDAAQFLGFDMKGVKNADDMDKFLATKNGQSLYCELQSNKFVFRTTATEEYIGNIGNMENDIGVAVKFGTIAKDELNNLFLKAHEQWVSNSLVAKGDYQEIKAQVTPKLYLFDELSKSDYDAIKTQKKYSEELKGFVNSYPDLKALNAEVRENRQMLGMFIYDALGKIAAKTPGAIEFNKDKSIKKVDEKLLVSQEDKETYTTWKALTGGKSPALKVAYAKDKDPVFYEGNRIEFRNAMSLMRGEKAGGPRKRGSLLERALSQGDFRAIGFDMTNRVTLSIKESYAGEGKLAADTKEVAVPLQVTQTVACNGKQNETVFKGTVAYKVYDVSSGKEADASLKPLGDGKYNITFAPAPGKKYYIAAAAVHEGGQLDSNVVKLTVEVEAKKNEDKTDETKEKITVKKNPKTYPTDRSVPLKAITSMDFVAPILGNNVSYGVTIFNNAVKNLASSYGEGVLTSSGYKFNNALTWQQIVSFQNGMKGDNGVYNKWLNSTSNYNGQKTLVLDIVQQECGLTTGQRSDFQAKLINGDLDGAIKVLDNALGPNKASGVRDGMKSYADSVAKLQSQVATAGMIDTLSRLGGNQISIIIEKSLVDTWNEKTQKGEKFSIGVFYDAASGEFKADQTQSGESSRLHNAGVILAYRLDNEAFSFKAEAMSGIVVAYPSGFSNIWQPYIVVNGQTAVRLSTLLSTGVYMKYGHLFASEGKFGNEVSVATQKADFIDLKAYAALDAGEIWSALKDVTAIASFGTGAYLGEPSSLKQFNKNMNIGLDLSYRLSKVISIEGGVSKSVGEWEVPSNFRFGVRVKF